MRWTALFTAGLMALGITGAAQAQTFRWAGFTDAFSMDPYSFNETFTLGFTGNIYDGLVTRGKDLSIKPSLAVSWEQEDPKTWVFKLRKGVKFHNGNEFDAQDVVFSFERATSEGSDIKAYFSSVADVTARDKYTVVFKTKRINPILLEDISYWWIMDKEWSEANDSTEVADIRENEENHATRNANGTGPFELVSREADVRTELKRNDDWWGWGTELGTSNVEEAIFTPIKQDSTRIAALLSGDVDFMYPVPVQDIPRLKSGGIEVMQGPELRTIFLGMDQFRDELLESSVEGENPFKDPRVRLAMYKAIDVNAIVDKIMKGAAIPAKSMVAPAVTGYDESFQRMEYDPEAAKELLAEAGYPDGFEVGFDCPNDRYVNDEQICQAVTAMWAKIGVKADLLAQTKSIFFGKILKRDTSVYLLGWSPSTVDGLNVLNNLLVTPDKEGGVGRFNLGGYSNAEVDRIAQEAATELDADKRTELLQKGLNLAHKDVGSIPLHHQQVIWAARDNVDVAQRSDNVFALRWATVNN